MNRLASLFIRQMIFEKDEINLMQAAELPKSWTVRGNRPRW